MARSNANHAPIAIRFASIDDVPRLFAMIQKFAAELGADGGLHASEDDWRRNGFGPQAKFRSLIAECGDAAIGFATYSSLYLPDLGEDSLAVHQIYVDTAHRRRGVAKALLARIAATTAPNKRPLIQIGTTPALGRQRFFEGIGCQIAAGYMTYLLFGEALTGLAASVADLVN
jgi:GNAT superfamily N-acetyltransferase